MKRLAIIFFFIIELLFLFSHLALAQITAPPTLHHTVIISQVRGRECCSPGGTNELKRQIQGAEKSSIPLTLTVRYDALEDPEFILILRRALKQGHEIGAFLEITPQLAQESGVAYSGPVETWYQAQQSYLIGYKPDDRQKIIDQYMQRFRAVFGNFPTTTTAWIIDTPSLKYLREKYGVLIHEITREQWGTDSYTLWGGPPHQPYWPSDQWAFQPSASVSATLPLIVRQTIADPLWNYGDTTSSHTSQPNDYDQKERGFKYFRHLFSQAQSQSWPTTFSLLGLENSMPEKHQQEFVRQLEFVGEWQGPDNQVLTAQQLARWYQDPAHYHPFWVDAGRDEAEPNQQAWFVTTPHYRARLRQDKKLLYLTDLRLYSSKFEDPYASDTASRSAYWIVPFVLDGARFWTDDQPLAFHEPFTDQVTDRPQKYSQPESKLLSRELQQPLLLQVQPDQFSLGNWISFSPNSFLLGSWKEEKQSPLLKEVIKNNQWQNGQGQALWGLSAVQTDGLLQISPQIWNAASLVSERESRYPYLFPELRNRPIDATKSTLLLTNRFAQAGRNPVRIAFFPKDASGFPIVIDESPAIVATGQDVTVQTSPDIGSGLVFADIWSPHPQKTIITLEWHDITLSTEAVFAPNCQAQWKQCLTRPQFLYWYLRNWLGDQYRSLQQRFNSENKP